MPREIANASLKDPSIVALLPASGSTREDAGVVWYDVRADPDTVSCRLDAVDVDGAVVETISARSLGSGEFIVTSESPDGTKRELTLVASNAEGSPQAHVRFEDGRELLLRESGIDSDDLEPNIIGDHWRHVIDPVVTLADALKVRAADSNSWGCTSCCVLLGGMAAGTFVAVSEGSLAAGAGVVYASATFIENCEGACA
jgi:hypothetical protein